MSPCQRGSPPRQGAALTGTAKIVIHAVHANSATVILDILFIRVSLLISFLLLVLRIDLSKSHAMDCAAHRRRENTRSSKIPLCRTFKTGVAKRKDRRERCLTTKPATNTLRDRQSLFIPGISLAPL